MHKKVAIDHQDWQRNESEVRKKRGEVKTSIPCRGLWSRAMIPSLESLKKKRWPGSGGKTGRGKTHIHAEESLGLPDARICHERKAQGTKGRVIIEKQKGGKAARKGKHRQIGRKKESKTV